MHAFLKQGCGMIFQVILWRKTVCGRGRGGGAGKGRCVEQVLLSAAAFY